MNNNCFDNKIKKILDCGKQCNCTPIIVGPTGPTGPQGPASIAVGVTTTTDPGTNASVTNVGILIYQGVKQVQLVLKVYLEQKVQQAHPDHKAFKDFKVYKVQLDQPDQQDPVEILQH